MQVSEVWPDPRWIWADDHLDAGRGPPLLAYHARHFGPPARPTSSDLWIGRLATSLSAPPFCQMLTCLRQALLYTSDTGHAQSAGLASLGNHCRVEVPVPPKPPHARL
ncbi:hypothetical protein Sya03_19530 [Spirilliplanes yamanashiensis]|uniref:Uncharacterized protein n=1 Tax=Spirilliplanes yamanashiensis TaxID=42233 RepID=A0A8J3Y682_9ACTN|nr:hypothetical protein Sya03_19530 [Spirilliplanes yamanashiensis]